MNANIVYAKAQRNAYGTLCTQKEREREKEREIQQQHKKQQESEREIEFPVL